jgi:hypothetical protein
VFPGSYTAKTIFPLRVGHMDHFPPFVLLKVRLEAAFKLAKTPAGEPI